MKILSRADELVLLSIWRLQSNAYGVTIRKHIIEMTGKDWSVGAIYDSLEKLTNCCYLDSIQGDPTPERGGRSKRYFKLTPDGLTALKKMKEVQDAMWHNLPNPDFEVAI